jgi:uncharacterized protein (TIGR02001 family)
MKQVKYLSAAVLLALSGAAQADVTSTITLTNDYDFRGMSQTLNDAAVQASIDYAHESGFYLGTWASNIDEGFYSILDPVTGDLIGSARTEVDFYTGFKIPVGDLGLDFGLSYYTYAGASDYNYAEVYAKASFKFLAAGVFYSNDFGGKATGDSGDSAMYVYADAAIPVGPISLLAHAGMSDGDGIEEAVFYGVEDSYTDYSFGLSYAASGFTTALKYVFVDAGDAGSDDRVILTVSAGLPLPK